MNATGRAAITALLGLVILAPLRVNAWKPYTHNYTGKEILQDIDEARGCVTIGAECRAIPPEAAVAIKKYPSYYYAGTVGPDGFPDLTYGQAVIHPGGEQITEGTGAWLKYLLDKAWEAYWLGDPDGEKILAFTYGFLTHAAGDVWGHTVVNEMSHGVFPAVGEILTNVEKAAEAIRHIISEGYIGEATPGFDGNPEFEWYAGDYTDSSTEGFAYDVPKDFIYRTLVAPWAPTPIAAVRGSYSAARGPIIGTFLEMRDGLADFVPDPPPDPLAAAIGAFDDTLDALEDVRSSCDFKNLSDIWNCPADLADLGFDLAIDSVEAFGELIWTATEDLAYAVMESYIDAWVKDIDGGLKHWSDLGLATTQGLFDAQTRRNYQNGTCGMTDEGCKSAVSTVDVVLDRAHPFIMDHLLSMAGVPDAAIEVAEILGEIGDVIDDVLGYIGLPFEPFKEAADAVADYLKSLILNAIWDVIGVDVDQLADILKSPTRYICAPDFSFDLPFLGTTTVPLFPGNEHALLDAYLGLPDGHHVLVDGAPSTCGRLVDGVKYAPGTFYPITDTIQLGKLLLLDGPELDRVLGDILGRTIVTYAAGENIMGKSTIPGQPWLALIDGDHSWRADGLPVFTDRHGERTGGNGTFPLWESCVLRPAFRQLFADWETPFGFPSLKDLPAADPSNDPYPPTSTIEAKGNVFVDPSGRIFLGSNGWLVLSAHDGPVSPVNLSFADKDVKTRFRVSKPPATGTFVYAGNVVDAILLTQGDGQYFVEYQSSDPCHTFDVDTEPVGTPEASRTLEVHRDSAPPVTTCGTPPFGSTFPTDAYSTATFSLDDGQSGAGIASFTATIDGDVFAAGPVPIAQGATIDMFRFWPGVRTVAVTGTDNLGNTGTTNCTFAIHATTVSLITNLNRARAEGSVPSTDVFNGLMDKLVSANKADVTGRRTPEVEKLDAFVNQLLAQRGKGIAPVRADQLIAYARDLISRLLLVSGL